MVTPRFPLLLDDGELSSINAGTGPGAVYRREESRLAPGEGVSGSSTGKRRLTPPRRLESGSGPEEPGESGEIEEDRGFTESEARGDGVLAFSTVARRGNGPAVASRDWPLEESTCEADAEGEDGRRGRADVGYEGENAPASSVGLVGSGVSVRPLTVGTRRAGIEPRRGWRSVVGPGVPGLEAVESGATRTDRYENRPLYVSQERGVRCTHGGSGDGIEARVRIDRIEGPHSVSAHKTNHEAR
jgi:hypothetical protein